MGIFKKIFILFFFFLIAPNVQALVPGSLIKSDQQTTVYYLSTNKTRHPFPTEGVYKSWYPSFSGIQTLTMEDIARYPLDYNVTVRPGVYLVSFKSDNNFYAVEPGGVLRPFVEQKIIEEIYGSRWRERLIVLPDSFFGDYTLGPPIAGAHQLPDGLVYQLISDGRYYYKINNLIWPFKDWAAVQENNFLPEQIVVSDSQFDKRKRLISGLDQRIFNPVAEPIKNNADCENRRLKAAFILVYQDRYQPEEIEKINSIKSLLAAEFSWASQGLSRLDTSFPLVILGEDPELFFLDRDGQLKPDNEVINTFYDFHPDLFDFIIVYNNFVVNESVYANYVNVTNHFVGTGNYQINSAYRFGSQGKLKGLVNMGNLNKYNLESVDSRDQAVNYLLHELLHHWSGRAIFLDEQDQPRYDLVLGPNYNHWNMYVDFISPLGGNGWRDNGDGTFTSKITLIDRPYRKNFSDLDLYFMGLLPKQFMPPINYLSPDEPGAVGNIIAGELKQIKIDEIIKAIGEWRCVLSP